MSSTVPIDVTMNSQWFGTKAPKPSSKLVDGKRSKPKPEVQEEAVPAEQSVSPEVPETDVASATPELLKDEVEAEETHGRGVLAKLAIPVAAAVAVWAVVTKVAA